MTLDIQNIGMIKKTKIPIEFEGMTVIAGSNSTGKSTISKVLYCIYSSLYDIGNQVNDYVNINIKRNIRNLIINSRIQMNQNYKSLLDTLRDCSNFEDIKYNIVNWLNEKNIKYDETALDKISLNISNIVFEDDKELKRIVVNEKFDRFFHSQVNNMSVDSVAEGRIDLYLSKKHLTFDFVDNMLINMNVDVNILHNPTYYDGPHIINDDFGLINPLGTNIANDFVKKLVINESISYEGMQAKEKASGLFKKFDMFGSLNIDLDNDTVEISGLKKPLNICELSNGLKTIVLLKNLIESGNIIKEDVLILDEPEINLHPEWQLELARILVELQKKLELTILISTHSPYFLTAIDTYSYKNGIQDKCRYYLATSGGEIKNVSDNVNEMYESLSEPFNRLMNERREYFNDKRN